MRVCEDHRSASTSLHPAAVVQDSRYDELQLADLRHRYQRGLYQVQVREVSARIIHDHLVS